jgi:tetratricopeptide (TPR) repeat protein
VTGEPAHADASVANTIIGSTVNGHVIQARDIRGSIYLPAPPPLPTPRQLPPAPGGFVGRAREIAKLTELVAAAEEASQLAVVTGIAGVGKSSLVLWWGHHVRAAFPDGGFYVDLGGFRADGPPVEPGLALAGFLRALNVSDRQIPTSIEDRSALWRTMLDGKRVLVVADNARTVDQVRPLLAGSRGAMVVVTSRNRFRGLIARDGACLVSLDVLSADESLQLLSRQLGADVVGREADAAARMSVACGHLPLALRIAAARVSNTPRRPLAAAAEALERKNVQLTFLRTPDGDPAGAVHPVFSWSYDALSPAAARLFRLLGVLPGADIRTEAVAAAVDLPTPDTDHLLEELAEASLVSEAAGPDRDAPGHRRWTMHDLIRQFAAQLAGPAEHESALLRLLDWYLSHAAAVDRIIWPGQTGVAPASGGVRFDSLLDAVAWFDAEQANLVSSVTAAVAAGRPQLAARMAVAMYSALYRRWQLTDLLATHEAALAALAPLEQPQLRHRLLYGLGDALSGLGETARALECQQEALGGFQAVGDTHAEARVLHGMANNHLAADRPERALELFREALDLFTDVADRHGVRHTLNGIANAFSVMGEWRVAMETYGRALEHFRADDDPHGEAHALYHLAGLEIRTGDFKSAVAHCEVALQRFAAESDQRMIGTVLHRYAYLHARPGRLAEAAELYQHAAEAFASAGDPDAAQRVLNARTRVIAGEIPTAEEPPIWR